MFRSLTLFVLYFSQSINQYQYVHHDKKSVIEVFLNFHITIKNKFCVLFLEKFWRIKSLTSFHLHIFNLLWGILELVFVK